MTRPRREATRRIKLRTLPNTTVLVYRSEAGPWIVHAFSAAKNVRTGKPDFFGLKDEYRWRQAPSTARLAKAVRKAVRRHLLHELDEGLTVDGKRPYDPHRKRHGL